MNFQEGHTVGIDLGTTSSAIARFHADGRPKSLSNSDGRNTTPSIVLLGKDGQVVIGPSPERCAQEAPERVIEGVKRHLGNKKFFVIYQGKKLTAEFLAALVFQRLKQDSEQKIGPIGNAVITAPYYFSELRRKAIQYAAQVAGLNVLEMVAEPAAITLAYAMSNGELGRPELADSPKTLLIFDLGGGTFDVTVVRYTSTQFRVLATDGDARLGGVDWTRRLTEYVADQFAQKFNEDPRVDKEVMRSFTAACETAKRELCSLEEATLNVNWKGNSLELKITRNDFERICEDLFKRVQSTTQLVMQQAGVEADALSDVLLVGGATSMPAVTTMLVDVCKRQPNREFPAEEIVAQGAAVYAAILEVQANRSVPGLSEDLATRLRSLNPGDFTVFSPSNRMAAAADRVKQGRQDAASGAQGSSDEIEVTKPDSDSATIPVTSPANSAGSISASATGPASDATAASSRSSVNLPVTTNVKVANASAAAKPPSSGTIPTTPASQPEATPPVDTQAIYQTAFEQGKMAVAYAIMAQIEANHQIAEQQIQSMVAWTTSPEVEKEWFGWASGNKFGPVDWNQVFDLAKTGQLTPTDFIRNGHFSQFGPASNIPGLFNAVAVSAKATETMNMAKSLVQAALATMGSASVATDVNWGAYSAAGLSAANYPQYHTSGNMQMAAAPAMSMQPMAAQQTAAPVAATAAAPAPATATAKARPGAIPLKLPEPQSNPVLPAIGAGSDGPDSEKSKVESNGRASAAESRGPVGPRGPGNDSRSSMGTGSSSSMSTMSSSPYKAPSRPMAASRKAPAKQSAGSGSSFIPELIEQLKDPKISGSLAFALFIGFLFAWPYLPKSRGEDRKKYYALKQLLDEIRQKRTSAPAELPAIEKKLTELGRQIAAELKNKANREDPAKQCLLWAARDEIPRFVKCGLANPDTFGEQGFEGRLKETSYELGLARRPPVDVQVARQNGD